MCKGLVNRILPFSSVDGPGNRTVIFLQGCNFNCLYCHNPETIGKCRACGRCVSLCPYDALSIVAGQVKWHEEGCKYCDRCLEICNENSSPRPVKMTVDEVAEKIIAFKSFISGITISGGECTLQCGFIISLFRRVKEIGLTTFLDTNGSIALWQESELISLMDMAMVDLKSYDPKEHRILTCMDNEVVIENIKYLAKVNKLYEVRTVIVPETLNNYYNVDMISKLIVSLNSSIRYKLIRYRPKGVRLELIDSYIPRDEMMNELVKLAAGNGCENVIVV